MRVRSQNLLAQAASRTTRAMTISDVRFLSRLALVCVLTMQPVGCAARRVAPNDALEGDVVPEPTPARRALLVTTVAGIVTAAGVAVLVRVMEEGAAPSESDTPAPCVTDSGGAEDCP